MKYQTDDNEIYEQMADALDRLPNGFPRTPAKLEIRILQKLFTPEEAELASQLTGTLEPVDKIAARLGFPEPEAGQRLVQLARLGAVWFEKREGKAYFRLAPFIVGIYEASLDRLDHELAHLVENYMAQGGAAGIMGPQPALHRVVPAQKAVKSEWILPYDDVRAILLSAQAFNLRDCICREQQTLLGQACSFPLTMCLNFSYQPRDPWRGDISQEEALTLLDRSEEVGLVHTVSNVLKGFGYICNCCGCCCGILRGITEWGIQDSVAHANYYAVIDPQICSNCGTCRERCHVDAIQELDGVSVVEKTRCIGCGLCVTGCSTQAASLVRKLEAEIIHPPVDFAAWERERLDYRSEPGGL